MSFLCTTTNKEVSYYKCVNECQYVFKSACIDQMNEAYNQALEDALSVVEWDGYTLDIKKRIEQLKK